MWLAIAIPNHIRTLVSVRRLNATNIPIFSHHSAISSIVFVDNISYVLFKLVGDELPFEDEVPGEEGMNEEKESDETESVIWLIKHDVECYNYYLYKNKNGRKIRSTIIWVIHHNVSIIITSIDNRVILLILYGTKKLLIQK